jgi:uncharacterized protein with PQ loop repeat
MVALIDVVSVVGTCAQVTMLLGPMPDMRTMIRARSTGVTPFMPFVAMFANSWIWTAYGYLDKTIFPVAVCNFVGVLLATFYTSVFYWFSAERAYAHKLMAGFGLLVVLLTIYGFVAGFGYTGQSRKSVTDVFGYIGIVTNTVFFASPFEGIRKVLKFRSAVFIPIVLVAAGLANSSLWVFYSLLKPDWFIFVPNAAAVLLAVVQVALYWAFHPSTHPYEPTEVAEEGKDLEAAPASIKGVASPSFVALQSPHVSVPKHD